AAIRRSACAHRTAPSGGASISRTGVVERTADEDPDRRRARHTGAAGRDRLRGGAAVRRRTLGGDGGVGREGAAGADTTPLPARAGVGRGARGPGRRRLRRRAETGRRAGPRGHGAAARTAATARFGGGGRRRSVRAALAGKPARARRWRAP